MADESKVVGYCALSGQVLKGKQLKAADMHETSDGVIHRLVRWAGRRYEWVGDQLRHKVTGQLIDIHPNAKADAETAPWIDEHADPYEPKKERKSKKAAQPVTQDAPPAENDEPITQPAEEPEGEEEAAPAETWGGPVVESEDEDEVVD